MQVAWQILGLGLIVMIVILGVCHCYTNCGMFCVVDVAVCVVMQVWRVPLKGGVFVTCVGQRQNCIVTLVQHLFALRFGVVFLFGVVAFCRILFL